MQEEEAGDGGADAMAEAADGAAAVVPEAAADGGVAPMED